MRNQVDVKRQAPSRRYQRGHVPMRRFDRHLLGYNAQASQDSRDMRVDREHVAAQGDVATYDDVLETDRATRAYIIEKFNL